jgi:hypothetical protein
LTARVATSGVTWKRVIAMPQMRPEIMPEPIATTAHWKRSALSPAGNLVTKTAASEMTPGTVRSRPPCWITSVWPIAAIARMDANESTLSSELAETLPVARKGLTMNRMAVAGQITRNCG